MQILADTSRSALVYRIIIGLFLITFSGSAAFILLVAIQAIETGQVFYGSIYAQNVFSFMDGLDWGERLGVAAVACIAGLISITIIFRLFSTPTTSTSVHILDIDERGIVVVDSSGISTIATQAALSAHGVVDARVFTKGASSAPLRLKVDVAVYPGANVKRAGSEVREAIREAVETLVGIDVGDIAVNAHIIKTDALVGLIK
jgi:hypothetical protein